jgi:hypothetical protein
MLTLQVDAAKGKRVGSSRYREGLPYDVFLSDRARTLMDGLCCQQESVNLPIWIGTVTNNLACIVYRICN